MANGTIMAAPWMTFFTDAGAICSTHKVFVYAAGTTTKINSFSDVGLTTANANPYLLDSSGRMTAFLTPGISYKFVLTTQADSDPPVSAIKTQDNIVGLAFGTVDLDITGTAGEALSAGNAVYLSDGSGGTTAGRWYKTDADTAASSTTAQSIGMVPNDIASAAAGIVRLAGRITGLSGLTIGAVYYISATAGAITSSAPSNVRAIAVADASTSVVLSQGLTAAMASATQAGLVSTTTQTFAGVKTFDSAPVLAAGATFASTSAVKNFIFARSTSNVTKNANTTFANVTDLAFAVAASETWVFLFLLHGTSSDTADFKYTLTGPAAPTGLRFGVVSTGLFAVQDDNTFGDAITSSGSTGLDVSVIMSGLLVNGANAGTVQLQFAQNTSDASDSIIYANSCVLAFRVN